MLTHVPRLDGVDLDLGTIAVTAEHIRNYALAIGDQALASGPCDRAPLGVLLALRGGPVPEVDLAAGTLSVHASHTITVHRPLTVPATYVVRARLADLFEKNG